MSVTKQKGYKSHSGLITDNFIIGWFENLRVPNKYVSMCITNNKYDQLTNHKNLKF